MLTTTKNKITALYMGQTDTISGLWFPVQKMTWDDLGGEYRNCQIAFLQGARKLEQTYPERPHIVTLGSLSQIYQSDRIETSIWRNRLPVNRNPKPEILSALEIDFNCLNDPVEYVARSGGYRKGDSKDLFPEVEADDKGDYNFIFRPVDSWCFISPNKPELNVISPGEEVTAIENQSRIELRCRDSVIGYAPGYIRQLLEEHQNNLRLTIARVNPKHSYEYQFLCQGSLNYCFGIPFTNENYHLIDG